MRLAEVVSRTIGFLTIAPFEATCGHGILYIVGRTDEPGRHGRRAYDAACNAASEAKLPAGVASRKGSWIDVHLMCPGVARCDTSAGDGFGMAVLAFVGSVLRRFRDSIEAAGNPPPRCCCAMGAYRQIDLMFQPAPERSVAVPSLANRLTPVLVASGKIWSVITT